MEKHGINKENLELSVSPKDNFYLYANGGWKKSHPLEGEYARFGTFDLLRENARKQLQSLVFSLSENPDSKIKGSVTQKISDLYSMGMDYERQNREGASPIKKMLERAENFEEKEFTEILAWMHLGIGSSFFGTGVGPDPMDSDMNIMHLGEVGLGLGDRDYYIEKSKRNEEVLEAYQKYIKRVLELCGYDQETRNRIWNNLITIETEFAIHKMTREERRDPMARYNIMSLDEMKTKYPNIEWDRYFSLLGVEDIDRANIGSARFMEFLDSYLPTLSLRQIKDIIIVDIATGASNLLGDDFIEAGFEFEKVMSGVKEQTPRWKRALGLVNSMFGEAVGQLYVEKYFPEENKRYMVELVGNLKDALARHIKELTWMGEATKEKALEKLSTLKVKIGYPDKWKDYSEIEINPERSYQENVLDAARWFVRDNYDKLGKPVDKEEWHMYPQTVNAYYNPTSNEICFPAGILQPPYFDVSADDALNYGGIGVVIGHEMTHGFDDSGRKFDKDGNLEEWWQEDDSKRFVEITDKLVEQFNAVEVAPGVNCNGLYTLGENIADQGGLRVAMTAYLDSRKEEKPVDIDGFSPLQRFYLAYANVWADNIREEEILERTKSDPHSLGVNRVNVTLRNLDPFFEAFDIRENDPMFRKKEDRVVIW